MADEVQHLVDERSPDAPPAAGDGVAASTANAPRSAATAYGRHLLVVLKAALSTEARIFSLDELRLIGALAALPTAAADLVARLVQRKRLPVQRDSITAGEADIDAAVGGGWLQRPFPDAVSPTAAAQVLVRVALLAATADPGTDLSFMTRLALSSASAGHLALPRDCPSSLWLAEVLGGAGGSLSPRPKLPGAYRDRAAIDACLAAWDARNAGPSPEHLAKAIAAVQAASGQPLPLIGYHLDALYHWSHLAWDCLRTLSVGDPRREAILDALRAAPLGPGLVRHFAQETWRAAQRGAARKLLAGTYADWAVFSTGERARWRLRATGERVQRRKNTPWRVRHLAAWLDHAADGSVLAEGEGVEAHALRRLAGEGFSGVHAEGGFWLALTSLVFHDALAAPVPGAWPAPLQALPLDWRRWGFAARRRALIRTRLAEVQADPLAVVQQAQARCAGHLLPGFVSPPDPAATSAVCARLPRMTLVRLLERLIDAPGEAGGLPDLVVWKPDTLELWEVKSPGDQLSDRQRAWLAWFDQEGVACGVLRLDPRECRQLSLFSGTGRKASADGERGAAAPRPRPQRVRKPAAASSTPISASAAPFSAAQLPAFAPAGSRAQILALGWHDGAVTPLTAWTGVPAAAATASGAAVLADPPTLWVGDWRGGLGPRQCRDWDRPVDAVIALAVAAVYLECRVGRTITRRRWVQIPAGWHAAALVADQASPGGGLRPVLTLLRRRGGWLSDAILDCDEPVLIRQDEVTRVNADTRVDWRAHPAAEPPRPEHRAWMAGYGREVDAQLQLIGSATYALLPHGDEGLTLALDPREACLWVATDRRLMRGELPWASR
jgi:hypothetical protein